MAGRKGRSGRKANELPLRHILGEILDELDPLTGRKRMHRVARELVELAEQGDLAAIREVWDRMDGKATQRSENTHHVSGALELVKKYVGHPDGDN